MGPELHLVYSDTCGPCQMFKPVWEKLCNEYSRQIAMKKTEVNSYEGSPIAKAASASGVSVPAVPTILYVDKEGNVSKVPDRSPEAIASFIKIRTPGEVIPTNSVFSGGGRRSRRLRRPRHRSRRHRGRRH
uniref:Thioredoxin domain-containing protein n=1 Tax=viral metagenome TaxID=1070528 RepID=A0A6C0E7S3_9ZZZZ